MECEPLNYIISGYAMIVITYLAIEYYRITRKIKKKCKVNE